MSVVGRLTFLYEDSGPTKNFGPHSLLRACVGDATGISPWDGRLTDCRPLKGNGNVVRACWDEKLADGPHVVAVLDADKLRELPMLRLLGIESKSTESAIQVAIHSRSPFKDRLTVRLIQQNAESLVAAALECGGKPETPNKSVNSRDRILNRVAWLPDRRDRDCVRTKVPSFAGLVDDVVVLLR